MKAAAVLALALAAAPPTPRGRVYDPLDTADMEAMAKRLLTHVALLEIRLAERGATLWAENPRTGFAAVLPDGRLLALSHLLDDAERITVIGPKGRTDAKVALRDDDRRVAVLTVDRPLPRLGLAPVVGWVSKGERRAGMDVLALVSTLDLAGVSRGVLTHEGTLKEYGGYPRIDLKLTRGMPIFDVQARLLGFSRVVAWDTDRYMFVPKEKVDAALAAPAAAKAAAKREAKAAEAAPWWVRKRDLTEESLEEDEAEDPDSRPREARDKVPGRKETIR